MLCASCKSPVSEDSMFCLACGALQDDAHAQVVQGFVEELVGKATGSYEEKHFSEAIAEFQRILEIQPDDQEVREWLLAVEQEYSAISGALEKAKKLLAQRRYQDAQAEAWKVLDLAPGYPDAENVVAQATRSISDFEDAVSIGKELLETNRFEQALEKLRLALEIDPYANEIVPLKQDAEGRLSAWEQQVERVKNLRDAHSFTEAISFAEGMARKRPFDTKLTQLRAEIKSTVQTLEESRSAGDKAIREGRWSRAAIEWERVLRILPEDRKAREKLDKAITEAARARAARVRNIIKFGSLGAAVLIILIIIMVNSSNRSHLEWGKEYLRSGEPAKALAEFEKTGTFLFISAEEIATLKQEAAYQAHLMEGHTARMEKDWARAKAEYEQATRLATNREEADKLIELVNAFEALDAANRLAESGDYPAAIDAAKKLSQENKTFSDMPEAGRLRAAAMEAVNSFRIEWLKKARELLSADKYLAASVQLRKIISKCPTDSETQELLTQCRTPWLKKAQAMRDEGKWDDALLEYRRMSVSFPGDETIAREVRGTKAMRNLRKAHALFKLKKYHSALSTTLETQQWTSDIPKLRQEAAGLAANINKALDDNYARHMANARGLVEKDKLEEAKTALEQALLYRETQEAKALSQTVVDRLSTPEGMIYIPTGPCTIGDSTQEFWKIEGPTHKVNLPAYYIDKHPVTNAQYQKFVKATKHRLPSHWAKAGRKIPPGKENHPVTHVNLADAKAYAKWAGKRLPTEEEWEKAARGPDGLKYPWGNEYRAGAANDEAARKKGTSPVGAFPGTKSPYGCLDMAGNVWEWTGTKLCLYPGSEEELEPGEEKCHVVKGGCYMDDKLFLRSSFRESIDPESAYATRPTLGFRCASSVKR